MPPGVHSIVSNGTQKTGGDVGIGSATELGIGLLDMTKVSLDFPDRLKH